MQIATTLEQSEFLTDLNISLETASMYYDEHNELHIGNPFRDAGGDGVVVKVYAWSLQDLLQLTSQKHHGSDIDVRYRYFINDDGEYILNVRIESRYSLNTHKIIIEDEGDTFEMLVAVVTWLLDNGYLQGVRENE